MNIYETIELSKIYKRILNVEINLKERLKFALTTTYPNKEFSRLIKFLTLDNIKNKYRKDGRNQITDLLNSKNVEMEKMSKFIDIAYLYDILRILKEYKPICKDKNFRNNFYTHFPGQNFINAQADCLNKLRNLVMHFNLHEYKNGKKDYLEALGYWERLLYCPNAFMYELPRIKPTTPKILQLLASNFPELFEFDDRIICDMFDDLAFINGKSVNNLPKLWTVGRQIYDLKKELNKPVPQTKQTNFFDTPLFKNL